jgi:Trk-type K+ transport system membrane component
VNEMSDRRKRKQAFLRQKRFRSMRVAAAAAEMIAVGVMAGIVTARNFINPDDDKYDRSFLVWMTILTLVPFLVVACCMWRLLKLAEHEAARLPQEIASTLPADEILVRGADEPAVAQSEVLLRAAEERKTAKDELLRMSRE